MRTIKASLKVNKNGRLFCTVHNTYKVSKQPKNDCKICWTLFENFSTKQATLDLLNEALHAVESNLFRDTNESN